MTQVDIIPASVIVRTPCDWRRGKVLDLNFILENPDVVRATCAERRVDADVDKVLRLADERRELIGNVEALRREQKEAAEAVRKADPADRARLGERGRELKQQVSALDEKLRETQRQLRDEQAKIPNLSHPDAPAGEDEADAVEVKVVGEVPSFDFTPLDHVQIGRHLELIDFDAGAKVAERAFYFLKNEAVLLELALVDYAIRILIEDGFTMHITPDVADLGVLDGIGYNPRGEETQIYTLAGTNLGLIATAEVTLGGMLRDTILEADALPVLVGGLSHCFRTEAGAHGRASRGLYRVHQFTKVEMFAFTLPEDSEAMHARLVALEEEIFAGLGIPFRVVECARGDLGGSAYRKFDLEAWMPGRGEGGSWGEVTSASNCTDYQARRLGIRFKNKGSKPRFVHTLNGTAVAVSRALVAILENNQQADGSVLIPEALRHRVGADRIGPR